MAHAGRMLALLLVAGSLAGCSSAPPPAPLVDQTRTIDPGQFLEVNLAMNGSQEIRATYEANRSLSWDVHGHDGRGIVVHDNGTGSTDTIAFQAAADGEFSLLWENPGSSPANVSVTVRGTARVTSVVP